MNKLDFLKTCQFNRIYLHQLKFCITDIAAFSFPMVSIFSSCLQSGKTSLGEDLYRNITAESPSAEEMLHSLNLKSEHRALEVINKLEAAAFAWKERMSEQNSYKSPVRTSWSFMKDSISEMDKLEFLLNQAESLVQKIKTRFPNLPQTFLDVTKVQYGKVSIISGECLSSFWVVIIWKYVCFHFSFHINDVIFRGGNLCKTTTYNKRGSIESK